MSQETTTPQPEATKPEPCKCWENTNAELTKRYNLKLADSLTTLAVRDFRAKHVLPLERTDGKKLQRREAKTLEMTCCPFCGKAY